MTQKVQIPVILKNGNQLLKAHEHWAQYPIDLIDEDYGHAQAHSLDGREAATGHTWVLLATPDIAGWERSDLTENDYGKWDTKRAEDERTLEVTDRNQHELDLPKQTAEQALSRERALKGLKKAGINIEDLRVALFS